MCFIFTSKLRVFGKRLYSVPISIIFGDEFNLIDQLLRVKHRWPIYHIITRAVMRPVSQYAYDINEKGYCSAIKTENNAIKQATAAVEKKL